MDHLPLVGDGRGFKQNLKEGNYVMEGLNAVGAVAEGIPFVKRWFGSGAKTVKQTQGVKQLEKQVAKEVVGADKISKPALNTVNTSKKAGSAAYKSLNVDDAQHFFPNIVDNHASQATRFSLKGGDGVTRDLYQINGSLRGKSGVFEWIVEGPNVVHRRFIPGGTVNGMPN